MKVIAGFCCEDGSIRKGEGHGWWRGRAHKLGERRKYELPKEDMRGAGVARMGEGVMEHKRAGVEESSSTSSSSESSDSNALKGWGGKKREIGVR